MARLTGWKRKDALKNHKREWSDCQKCPLGATATNHVLYKGPIPCTVLIVGNAPESVEDVLGLLLKGPAGSVLQSILDDLEARRPDTHLLPARICVSNVLACTSLGEDGHFRQPEKSEAKSCSPRLKSLIEIATPKKIVLAGKVAEKYFELTNKSLPFSERYMTERGNLLAIPHPSYLLRKGARTMQHVDYKRVVLTLKEFIYGRI